MGAENKKTDSWSLVDKVQWSQSQDDSQMVLLGSIQMADSNQDNEIGSFAAEERTAGTIVVDKMVHYYQNMHLT